MEKRFSAMTILLLLIVTSACNPAQPITIATIPPIDVPPTATPQPLLITTAILSLTPTATNTSTTTDTPANTNTPTVTATPTITPEPTYLVLRGKVTNHVSCFYGPSNHYLYKYGLLKGNRLDIIGYIADTGFIEVQAIGGHNPCWMNLKFMDVQGDIQLIRPVDPLTIKIPRSPYYSSLNWAKATREGSEVTITWDTLEISPGKDSLQEPYLVEVWVCQAGKLTFVPIGAYDNKATVLDEPGCSQASFGRVYGVEKHGYTKPLEIQWPQPELPAI